MRDRPPDWHDICHRHLVDGLRPDGFAMSPQRSSPTAADKMTADPSATGMPRLAVSPVRVTTACLVILPFLGLVAAGYLWWGGAFGWVPLGLLVGMYLLTGLGITVGFHRLFTHRSFEANRVVQWVLGVLGSMAVQGPLIQWVAEHRRHHRKSDQPGDPHSPHLHGEGMVGLVRGLIHAHLGWLMKCDAADLARYVPDLMNSRSARTVSQLFPCWVALGLLIPTVLGWAIVGDWSGGLLGFIWGGLVRIFFVQHVTWSINSICHLWGSQPFQTGDWSKNNFIFGLLALGEGWHNNHHAFPTSARHGLRWWQFDLSYLLIRGLEFAGVAWNVKRPPRQLVFRRQK